MSAIIGILANFSFSIPLIALALQEELTQESGEEGQGFQGKRILLVEDNELNREIAMEILKEYGLEVEEAD